MYKENRLWSIIKGSPRFALIKDNPGLYADAKKEAGLLTITGKDKYLLYLLEKGVKVTNAPNSLVAYLIGITDEQPQGKLEYKGGTSPDCVKELRSHNTQSSQVVIPMIITR